MTHIGVFKVLAEEGVGIDMMVGTSIGAIAMSCFGLDGDWRRWRETVARFLNGRGFARIGKGLTDDVSGRKKRAPNRTKTFLMKAGALALLLMRKSLVSRKHLAQAVAQVVPESATFSDLKTPCAAVLLDILNCEEVIIRSGSLREACVASANLAGFFPPYPMNGQLLVDASPVSSVPVDAARRLGAAGVIAVDIRSCLNPTDHIPSGADAAFRVMAMACDRANAEQAARADAVIAPGVECTYWSDFRDLDAHIDAGERAARRAMPAIRELVVRIEAERAKLSERVER